ncbi:MAG: carboxypeptidase regulatory-like domain-containing protein [Deinococcus sp.]|nr:carboxypeptidase regulatory-like domain-containing protein [Deinococcus sp.]
MRRLSFFIILGLVAGCGAVLPPAATTATLHGQVIDASTSLAVVADVTFQSNARSAHAERILSNGDGSFTLTGVPTGTQLTLMASAQGYLSSSRTITLDKDLELVLALQSAPQSGTTSSGSSTTIESANGTSVTIPAGALRPGTNVTLSAASPNQVAAEGGGLPAGTGLGSGFRLDISGGSQPDGGILELSLRLPAGITLSHHPRLALAFLGQFQLLSLTSCTSGWLCSSFSLDTRTARRSTSTYGGVLYDTELGGAEDLFITQLEVVPSRIQFTPGTPLTLSVTASLIVRNDSDHPVTVEITTEALRSSLQVSCSGSPVQVNLIAQSQCAQLLGYLDNFSLPPIFQTFPPGVEVDLTPPAQQITIPGDIIDPGLISTACFSVLPTSCFVQASLHVNQSFKPGSDQDASVLLQLR